MSSAFNRKVELAGCCFKKFSKTDLIQKFKLDFGIPHGIYAREFL
jgi:hypothetical protein